MKDLPNLDLLRSMAVLSVVFEHILLALRVYWLGRFPVAWIGVVGVFLFFVHTSLVLMWSMERRPHVLDFYTRRIFRIYPLAILAILVAVTFNAPVAGSATNIFGPPTRHLHDILSNMTLMGTPTIENVMWSLPLEVQMYILLPALFFYVQRNFTQWTLLVLFALNLYLLRVPPPVPTLFSAAPYFLSGVVAYVGFGRRKPTLPAWLLPIAVVALSAAFLLRPGFRLAGFFTLAVGGILPSFHQIRSSWLKRSTHLIARYSYGIYLSHPFGLVLGIYLMPHAPIAAQVSVVLLSTAVFSVAAYHLLEHPMIRLGSRVAQHLETRYEQHELSHYRIAPTDLAG